MKNLLACFSLLAFLSCAVNAWAQSVQGGGALMVPTAAPGVQANLTAVTDPAKTNDQTQGYAVGSLWQNANTGRVWIARSVVSNAAIWTMLELSDHPGYVTNYWYSQLNIGVFVAGQVPGAGSIRLYPGYIKERVTLSNLALRVTTLSAGGNVQAAIYANNSSTGRPTGNALVSTASMSTTTATTVTSAANVQLEPGLYWWATNCDNGVAIFASISNAQFYYAGTIGSSAGLPWFGGSVVNGLSVTQTFGTWPDLTSASFTEINSQGLPAVGFQIGSVP